MTAWRRAGSRARQGLLPLLAIGMAGCTMGPNYQRPKVAMPAVYRGATATAPRSSTSAKSSPASLGDEVWPAVFRDPALQHLIRTALLRNYDVRIAAARVAQAQALAGITRSKQFPQVNAGASLLALHNPKATRVLPDYQERAGSLSASVIWNLDFWGKYRRQTEAQRDAMLATEWGQRAVRAAVVSDVAAAYFQLRELTEALTISRQALASRQASLRLVEILNQNGSVSNLDLRQAQELVYTAQATIANLDRQRRQQENFIRGLLGENPGPVLISDKAQAPLPAPAAVPAGLPSRLLDRRPDIREAEANLMAATADIGVAKADLFPNIALTGAGGFESYALNRFFSAPSALWNVTGSAVQTVFAAGALRAGVRLTQAQKEEMLLAYQQSIQQALREVSDALIAYRLNQDFTLRQRQLTAAADDATHLSNVLYQHGGGSYLQVLTSETNSFAAELDLAQAQLQERLALVQLYTALGGGW